MPRTTYIIFHNTLCSCHRGHTHCAAERPLKIFFCASLYSRLRKIIYLLFKIGFMRKKVKTRIHTIGTIILLCSLFLALIYTSILSLKTPQMATGNTVGTVSFAQVGSAGVVLTNEAIDFSSGYVNGSCTLGYAILDSTLGTNPKSNCWVNTTSFLVSGPAYHRIQNTGTVPLTLNASANKHDAEEFFCGTPSGCVYSSIANISLKTFNAESGSCVTGALDSFRTLLSDSSNSSVEVCTLFKFNDNSNLLDIGIQIKVPIDVQPGIKTVLITYEAVST